MIDKIFRALFDEDVVKENKINIFNISQKKPLKNNAAEKDSICFFKDCKGLNVAQRKIYATINARNLR